MICWSAIAIRDAYRLGRTLLVLALLLPACKPADFDDHQHEYERLVVRARQEGEPAFLWLLSTAPADAKPLMVNLGIRAVHYNDSLGTVYLQRGGGYIPEYGYIYRLPSYGSTRTDRWDAGAEHVQGRWYFWEEP